LTKGEKECIIQTIKIKNDRRKIIMRTTRKENRIIKLLSKEISEFLGDNLVSITLFGSKARGNFDKDSDIDILIVVHNKNRKIREKLYDILFNIDPYYDYRISLKLLSTFEYQKNVEMNSPFIENLNRDGVRL